MISIVQKGNFKNTESFIDRVKKKTYLARLRNIAEQGVKNLAEATPKDTGKTASSWVYEINVQDGRISITWHNTNIVKYVNIAVILQYGHATRNGGWVEGRDYINPAMQPIFDKMAQDAWEVIINR